MATMAGGEEVALAGSSGVTSLKGWHLSSARARFREEHPRKKVCSKRKGTEVGSGLMFEPKGQCKWMMGPCVLILFFYPPWKPSVRKAL